MNLHFTFRAATRLFSLTLLFATSALALVCCKGDDGQSAFDATTGVIDAELQPDASNTFPGPPGQGLDLLFVIDNSGAMYDEQISIVENFGRFIDVLNTLEGGLPDIHIGVVSTDMGAGNFGIMNCANDGDGGILQNTATMATCTPPGPERFISDTLAADGVTRTRNYTGALDETFACIARLGILGCAFEQPLESMRRALDGSNPQNSGFLRPNAYLAVIILSDEDDCSVKDVSLFDNDPSLDRIDSSIGFLSSFRCFEFGVVCQPDTPRVPGKRNDCEPRDNSQFMYDVGEYVEFLRSLKSNPNNIIVASIVGPRTPVSVSTNDTRPNLNSSCLTGGDQASPAVRLAAFLDGFPKRNVAASICNDDLSTALVRIAELLVEVMGPTR